MKVQRAIIYGDFVEIWIRDLPDRIRSCVRYIYDTGKEYRILLDVENLYLSNYKIHFRRGYACVYICGKSHDIHHLVIGKAEKPLVVDHINRNRLDNRRCNLRHCTSAENNKNRGPNTFWSEDKKISYLKKHNMV